MAITTEQYFHLLVKHFKLEVNFEQACENSYPDALRLGCRQNEVFDHLEQIMDDENYMNLLFRINLEDR
jgi:hypothetical protein